ncbi:MAG: DsbA family protein [Planktomarina sp.]
MNNKILLGLVFVAALGVGAYFAAAPSSPSQPGPTLGAANAQTVDVDITTIKEMALGAEDAPITVIEYASYTCPHCRAFHEGTFRDLKANYIDTGKIRFIYREVYFDRYGLWGSIVARCGGGDKFFGISNLLYTQQSNWAKGSPAEIADNLKRIGLSAGLTQDQVDGCFSDGTKAQTLVNWFEANKNADGITSTPSFVINGTKYANMSYSEFQSILDAQ